MHHRTGLLGVAIVLVMATACRPETVSPEPTPSQAPSESASATPSASVPPASGTPAVSPGQGVRWTRIEPAAPGPSARAGHSWTVDPSSAVAYLFGGADDNGDLGDLWAYDMTADAWQQLRPGGPSPTGRSGHVAAWMEGIGLVVFGGGTNAAASPDVWAYDPGANAWRVLESSGAAPASRTGACGALDPTGRLWVTHGAAADGTLLADTWAFDPAASVWGAAPASPGGPAARTGGACWWSPEEGFTLYGGRSADGLALADAWSRLDATEAGQWSSGPDLGAPGRHSAALAASGSAARLMGGEGPDGMLLDELLSYDLSTRTVERFFAEGDGPDARLGGALVDDPEGERLLLFGGRGGSGAMAELWSVTAP